MGRNFSDLTILSDRAGEGMGMGGKSTAATCLAFTLVYKDTVSFIVTTGTICAVYNSEGRDCCEPRNLITVCLTCATETPYRKAYNMITYNMITTTQRSSFHFRS